MFVMRHVLHHMLVSKDHFGKAPGPLPLVSFSFLAVVSINKLVSYTSACLFLTILVCGCRATETRLSRTTLRSKKKKKKCVVCFDPVLKDEHTIEFFFSVNGVSIQYGL